MVRADPALLSLLLLPPHSVSPRPLLKLLKLTIPYPTAGSAVAIVGVVVAVIAAAVAAE